MPGECSYFSKGLKPLPLFPSFDFKFLRRVWSIHLSSTIFHFWELLLRELQKNVILSVIIPIYFLSVGNTAIFKLWSARVKPIRPSVALQLSQLCLVHFCTHAAGSVYQYLVLLSDPFIGLIVFTSSFFSWFCLLKLVPIFPFYYLIIKLNKLWVLKCCCSYKSI